MTQYARKFKKIFPGPGYYWVAVTVVTAVIGGEYKRRCRISGVSITAAAEYSPTTSTDHSCGRKEKAYFICDNTDAHRNEFPAKQPGSQEIDVQQSIPFSNSGSDTDRCRSSCGGPSNGIYDVIIIGGGVVGLAVAQALTAHTYASVLLLEKETSLVAGAASSGNSGLGCTGYDAPPGSLERRLLQRSIRIHQNLYRSFGLSLTGKHVRKCGSLIVAWTEEELAQLPHIVQENRDAGDTEAILLEREELLDLEPALSSDALGAVFCPREAVVEPWLVPIGYACSALSHGANIRTGRKVTALQLISSDDSASVDSLITAAPMITSTISHTEKSPPIWKVITEECRDRSIGRSYNGEVLTKVASAMPRRASTAVTNHRESDEIDGNSNSSTIAAVEGINRVDSDGGIYHGRVVINCAGLFGDELEALRRRALSALSTPASSDSSCRTNHSTSSGSRDSSSNEERTWSIAPRKGQFLVFKPLLPSSSSQTCPDSTGGLRSDVAQVQDPSLFPSTIIEPVATQFTKGVIVWSTVYGNVIVGPTAVNISSKTDRSTDMETVEKLRAYGEKVIPALKHAPLIGTYSGLRPATEHRDYQIYPIREHSWITVGGIRSTGLTASSGIAEYVLGLYQGLPQPQASSAEPSSAEPSSAEPSKAADTHKQLLGQQWQEPRGCQQSHRQHEYGLSVMDRSGVTESALNPLSRDEVTSSRKGDKESHSYNAKHDGSNSPPGLAGANYITASLESMSVPVTVPTSPTGMPHLSELSRQYRQSLLEPDNRAHLRGTVCIHGQRFRVTHPISSFGMETYDDEEAE